MTCLLALASIEGIILLTVASAPTRELSPTLQETGPSSLLFCFLGTLLGILLIILVAFIQLIYSRTKTTAQKSYLGIDLGYETLANKEIRLKIYNNEKSYIVINEISLDYKDGNAKDQKPVYLSRAFPPSGLMVEKAGVQTIPFLAEKESPPSFSVVGYADERENIDHTLYNFGVYKFDVIIVYGSVEKKINGLCKWFELVISYKAPSGFKIDIKQVDNLSYLEDQSS
jgi:hypothetical protein